MILELDSTSWAHVFTALRGHARFCRDNRIPVPAEVSEVMAYASERQRATTLHSGDDSPDTAFMSTPLAVNYTEAGRRLGVAKRTVERLVASGALPAVAIGGAPRIRVADLDEFVSRLGRHNFRDAVTVKSERKAS